MDDELHHGLGVGMGEVVSMGCLRALGDGDDGHGSTELLVTLFDNIGVMIRSGAIPPGTDHLGKCGDCEFRRFCNDRF